MQGKRALVTGAAMRVGRAIAQELHREGARVAIHYRNSKKQAEELAREFGGAPLVQGDQAADPERIVREAAEKLGGLDILVCSASEYEKAPSESLPRARFERMIAANLTGPFYLMQAALPFLRASGSGCIVNMVDICGTAQVWSGYAHYAASKAGLATLTKLLALEWAPSIRVNAVAPGVAKFPDSLPQADRDRIVARIPLRRPGTPEEVARVVAFLAREPYITGQIVTIDGGRTVNP
jgi:pteridine reductase